MLSIVSTRANTRALLPGLILAVAAAGVRAQESDIVQALGLSVYAGIRYQDQNAVLESAGQRQDGDHSYNLRLNGLLLGFGVKS